MIMKKIILIALIIPMMNIVMAQDFKLASPDNVIAVQISIDDGFIFSINYGDIEVIKESNIDMTVSPGPIFSDTPEIEKTTSNYVLDTIIPYIHQKSELIIDEYNELIFQFNRGYNLTFRAYNTGIAYRFGTTYNDSIRVVDETFDINFSKDATCLFAKENSIISHYERLYIPVKLDTLEFKDFSSLPLLVKSNNVNILITEADLFDYGGMFMHGGENSHLSANFANTVSEAFPKNGSDRNQILKSTNNIAYTKGDRTYPWRVLIISDKDVDLVENQLVYQLSRPLEIEDPSWIIPGKVAWDWYNANNIYGVDFESGINTETYKYYIDFASEYGLEYIILDEGWSKSTTIINEPNPDINIEELVSYGKEKNVGLILWVLWKPLDKNMDVLRQYQEWGIVGIKVDFMQRTDQYMVNYYERVAQQAANNKLLVDFHGAYKPSGLRRAYPNVLTYEGLKGNENNKWSHVITPEHNVTIPFIRMVAGPMDYTPGAMNNANEKNHQIIWTRPMSIGTRCHQVAMYVVYESSLQMLCESPSTYYKEKETTEFISRIPTTWDETIALYGKVSDYIVIARRSGDNWYIGGMTDDRAREFDIGFSFLPEGEFNITIMKDGINTDKHAQDYKVETITVSNVDTYHIKMAEGGGFAAIISKK
mgnify:CR=1 FL=1